MTVLNLKPAELPIKWVWRLTHDRWMVSRRDGDRADVFIRPSGEGVEYAISEYLGWPGGVPLFRTTRFQAEGTKVDIIRWTANRLMNPILWIKLDPDEAKLDELKAIVLFIRQMEASRLVPV